MSDSYIIQQTKIYAEENYPFKFKTRESAEKYISDVKDRLKIIVEAVKEDGNFVYRDQVREKAKKSLEDTETWVILKV